MVMKSTYFDKLAEGMSNRKNILVEEAISYKLGTKLWNFSAVKDRGKFVIQYDGKEVFYFDNIPLLEFWPPDFERSYTESTDSYKLKVVFNYRKLF